MLHYFIVTLVIFILVLFEYKKKKTLLLPSVFTLILYFVSILFSYPYIIINNSLETLENSYFESSIVFLFMLLLFLIPYIQIGDHKVTKIVLPNLRILNSFSIIIIVLSFISILFFTPIFLKVFSMNDLNEARVEMQYQGGFVSKSILATIASVISFFYIIPIILFFIYRTLSINKRMSILLLLSSFSYVIYSFAYVGRDGFIFWIFSFIGCYGLFKNFLQSETIKKIKKIIFIFIAFTLPLFTIITFDRFSDNPFSGFISYIGQSFPNFILSYNSDYPVSNGSAFPLFRELLGLPITRSESVTYGSTSNWVFGTFLKSLILNFDIIGTYILGLLLMLLIKVIFFNTKNKFYFHQLFIYFLFFQIYSQGVFYFRQYAVVGNFFILMTFVFYFIFLFLRKNHNIGTLEITIKR